MALANLSTAPMPSRDRVRLASLVDGDIIVPDRSWPCMLPGQGHTVRVDASGPYVGCHAHGRGRHHLAPEADRDGNVVGMRRYRP